MEQKQYKLAVVIPCWNDEKYISIMLQSIIAQTFQDWKLFLIDDGSTDSTEQIIQEYTSKDSRISYIKRNRLPKGAPTCRNIGIDLSEGAKYVIIFDADDIIAPYCFAQRVTYMEEHQELDFAIFKAKTFKHSLFESDSMMYGFNTFDNQLQAMLNWNLPMVGWTNIYKRTSLIKYDLRWDKRLLSLQDSDYNIQALTKGMQFDFAKGCKVDYFYRITNSGISKKIMTKAHYDSHLHLLNKTLDTVSATNKVSEVVLQNNILLFYNLICRDKDAIKKMLQMQWFKARKICYLKMWMYVLLRGRGKKYLYHREKLLSQSMNQKWHEAIEYNVTEFLNTIRDDDNLMKVEKMVNI